MKVRNGLACAIAGAFLGVLGTNSNAAQRTFVSTSGSDASVSCSLALPCRGFAKAITVTDPGGELVVLDSGGYGSVTVNQNVTILSPAGVYAGISVFGGTDGVTVMAPATNVVLRGLTINGQGGNNGIRVQAGEVHVENTVVSGMVQAGILVEGGTTVRISGSVLRTNLDGLRVLPTAGTVTVLVRDSEVSNNGQIGMRISPAGVGNGAMVTVERTSVTRHSGYGIYSGPGGGGTATIVVTQSVLSENVVAGVASAGSGATVWVRESAVTRNGTGLQQVGSSVLNACGANLLVANATAMSGTVNTGSCLDVASGSGTVTSLSQGTGITLSANPITTTGSIAADTAYLQQRVSGTCAVGSSIRTINGDGTVVCEADDVGTGTMTSLSQGTGITLSANPITTTGSIAADTAYLQRRVSGSCAVGSSIRVINSDGTVSCQADGPAFAFVLGGNNFGANAILGTNDDNPLTLKVNNSRVVRYEPNAISPNLIGGHFANAVTAGVRGATIAGGGVLAGDSDPDFGQELPNRVTDHYGTIGGGYANQAGDDAGATMDHAFATVAGGRSNKATGELSSVGGGRNNIASGGYSNVGGGFSSTASGGWSAVCGGDNNNAGGVSSVVGGGVLNNASGDHSVVIGGVDNTASGTYGIAGGSFSEARGDHSIALGHRAKTFSGVNNGFGTIVLADGRDFDFEESFDHRFAVRSTGGVRFVLGIDAVTGAATYTCSASNGNAWACASDRKLKHSLVELDGTAVLEKLAAMPIYQWQPKGENGKVKHYGPMAQDFHAAFGLGDDDKMIGMQDADGVALAAIQGVNQKLDERLRTKDEEIAALRSSLVELKRAVDTLMAAH